MAEPTPETRHDAPGSRQDTVTLPIVGYEVPRVAADAVALVGLGAMVVLDVIAWPIPVAVGLGALLARRR
ncbi:MAG: hypothetical protein M3256_09905 [Actinomycetota bacterium]|nr:hypothetical protein [Actinomycetota bacterium]